MEGLEVSIVVVVAAEEEFVEVAKFIPAVGVVGVVGVIEGVGD